MGGNSGHDYLGALFTGAGRAKDQAIADERMGEQDALDRFGENLSSGNVDLVADAAAQEDLVAAQFRQVARSVTAAAQLRIGLGPVRFGHSSAPDFEAMVLASREADVLHRGAHASGIASRRGGGGIGDG